MAEQDDPELVAACIQDPEELIAMLRRALGRGEALLVFDPPNGPTVASIPELLEVLEFLVANVDQGIS